MWFFVFSINFARTREGRPARRKLTELLVKSKKTLVTEPTAIFFVFQVNISCKTTSIILYFKYASFSVVTRKKRQNTNPHPDGNFFDDRFGLGILRDEVDRQCCVQSVTRISFSPVLVVSWVWMFQYPCYDSCNKLGGGSYCLTGKGVLIYGAFMLSDIVFGEYIT